MIRYDEKILVTHLPPHFPVSSIALLAFYLFLSALPVDVIISASLMILWCCSPGAHYRASTLYSTLCSS